MYVWVYTLGSVLLVSLISFIGVFLISLDKNRLKRILLYLVSFAVGGLFGDAMIHLIPEAFEQTGINVFTSLWILSGVMLFFILEKFLRWQHCHIPTDEGHVHPVATMNVIGDGVHNMLDGLIIGSSYLVSPQLGLTTTLAVILHEIPQEIGDLGILLHQGLSIKKALFLNFLSALMSVVGAVAALLLGSHIQGYTAFLIPLTAGGFLYIAGSDLIPELHHGADVTVKNSFLQFSFIILGVLLMAALLLIE